MTADRVSSAHPFWSRGLWYPLVGDGIAADDGQPQ
jgi:hypothetical protein